MNQVMVRDSAPGLEGIRVHPFNRQILLEGLLVLAGAMVLLLLLTSRVVNGFDEGITLTAAMRTQAGQVLHRDFYFNYGPAQPYLLAGLFKLFGPSVLVERVADVFFNSCLIATLYVLARRFCSRVLALSVALLSMLWLIGTLITQSVMNPAMSMLTFWASWLILPVDDDRVQRRRALGAGFLVAITFLFRYDVGVAIAAANLFAVVLIWLLHEPRSKKSPSRLVATVIGPYLAAFAITIIPAAIAYLSVAPLHDLLFDTVLYGANQYRRGRAMPFPRPSLGPTFSETALYLLPVIIALALWAALRPVIARTKKGADITAAQTPEWLNLVVVLSVDVAMLSMKGLIRIGVGGMYGSIILCAVIAALLFQHRRVLNIWLRGVLVATIILFVLTGANAARSQFFTDQFPKNIHLQPLVVNWILSPNRQPPSAAFRSWCHEDAPITRGFCFLLDENRIRTIRYLTEHTHPGDYLYVGLDHHDRILMNDNITYFAVQRLPAVRWSQLDPFLENTVDIQREMIAGLEQHKPPYVVLDSEFDNIWEPNGSSVSTGVHLLDDYIAAHYEPVQRYGKLSILRRR